jgi:hypothetical protein
MYSWAGAANLVFGSCSLDPNTVLHCVKSDVYYPPSSGLSSSTDVASFTVVTPFPYTFVVTATVRSGATAIPGASITPGAQATTATAGVDHTHKPLVGPIAGGLIPGLVILALAAFLIYRRYIRKPPPVLPLPYLETRTSPIPLTSRSQTKGSDPFPLSDKSSLPVSPTSARTESSGRRTIDSDLVSQMEALKAEVTQLRAQNPVAVSQVFSDSSDWRQHMERLSMEVQHLRAQVAGPYIPPPSYQDRD